LRRTINLTIPITLIVIISFILPTTGVIAGEPRLIHPNGEGYDDDRPDIEFDQKELMDVNVSIAGLIDDANNSVIFQSPKTTINSFLLKNPKGDKTTVLSGKTLPTASYYTPMTILANPGPGSDLVEPEIDIYKWDADNCDVIFEESFEDNAHNYMWWAQIDGDAIDVGTYYDGWAWNNNRACDGDHSFKSTMYNEYKNSQDDYFYMRQTVDVSEYSQVQVTFDTYVSGEFGDWFSSCGKEIYTPLDYLEFGVIDQGIMYYADNGDGQRFASVDGLWMPGNYYFFDTDIPLYDIDSPGGPYKDYTQKAKKIDHCPGWWRVTLNLPTSLLNCPETFGIWFGFHSDKERVNEGAYVDNIVIEGCLPNGEKIYQSHSEDWICIPVGLTTYEFPLDWNTVEPGTYKAILKVKNDEGSYDQQKEITFNIGTETDCAIIDMKIKDDFTGDYIPEGGMMTYNADLVTSFTYRNSGNVPLENVTIHASGYKLIDEEVFFDDFETGSDWVYYIDTCPLTTLTPPEWIGNAWSGNKVLYLGDPDIWSVVPGCEYKGYSQDTFNMEGVEDAWLDFYFMGSLPSGAELRVCLLGYRYLVGINGVLESFPGVMESHGMCEMDWIGPMQPMCNYESIDFMKLWNIIVTNGYMYDDNGHMTYETGIGFWLDTTECNNIIPSSCTTWEKPWSGVFIDDLRIHVKRAGEKVWDDAMIIQGPCNPSETCSDEFIWEDLPYSSYKVCVEAECTDDTNDQNNELCTSFIVLETMEKMSNVDFVDYTDIDCPEWCISNVVGSGDHYALATNCDSNSVPDASTVGMGTGIKISGDDCCPSLIDISHLETCSDVVPPPCSIKFDFETGPMGWTVIDGDGYPANWQYGHVIPESCIPGGVTGSWFYIDDDAAGSNAGPSTENWLISPVIDLSTYTVLLLEFDGDFQDMAGYGKLTVYASDGTTDYVVATFTNDVGGFNTLDPIDISIIGGSSNARLKFHYTDDGSWSWGALIDNVIITPTPKNISGKSTIFQSGFEEHPFDALWYINTGWLDSFYGYPNNGLKWAYCWSNQSNLTTPYLQFKENTELRFFYAAEAATHPMSLEVYCDNHLIWSDYNYTHTSYTQAIIDLSMYHGYKQITFVHLSNGFYGSLLDDIIITTQEPPQNCDEIPYKFTWQSSLYPDENFVQFAVAAIGGELNHYTLYGSDSYGDGWDSDYNSVYDCFIDVYVNNERVIEGFTVTTGSNKVEFPVSENDEIYVVYYGNIAKNNRTYENEQYWELRNSSGMKIYNSTRPPADETVGPFTGSYCSSCTEDTCPNLQWIVVDTFTGYGEGVASGNIAEYLPSGTKSFTWAFIYHGPEGTPGIGFHLHDFEIGNIFQDISSCYDNPETVYGDYYEDFEDGNKISECYNMQWCDFCYSPGSGIWASQYDKHTYIINQPEGADNAIIWCTEIKKAYEAYFTGYWSYCISGSSLLSVELSPDDGNSWITIALIGDDSADPLNTGHTKIPCTTYDLTPWAGMDICFRVRLQGQGFVNITDFTISGKEDRIPPTITITISGNNIGGNQYSGPVTVKIDAEDDIGLGEIHYILDGNEKVVQGDTTSFSVSTDGNHNIEAWAIDAFDNIGSHISRTFFIDNTPPTITITAPESGLYLFGRKLINTSKPIIIGAFTIEATAYDAQGVYLVQFLLNGEVINEDSSLPYDAYCAVKNRGNATITAIAIDGVGHTGEDTLKLKYYKFL